MVNTLVETWHQDPLEEMTGRTTKATLKDTYFADSSRRTRIPRFGTLGSALGLAPSTESGMAVQKMVVVDTAKIELIDTLERISDLVVVVEMEYVMVVADIEERMNSMGWALERTEASICLTALGKAPNCTALE